MMKLPIIILIILLNSCIAMPIMNNAIPMKEGEERKTLSGGVFYPEGAIFYGSIQYKHENTIVELSSWGIKAIQDLSNNKNLYVASFQSLYLAMIGFGVNAGIIFSYLLNDTRYYLSGRIDNVFIIPVAEGMGSKLGTYLNFTPTAGIVFDTFGKKMFLEFIYSQPLINSPNEVIDSETNKTKESPNSLYSEFFFSLQLGLSF